MINTHKRPEFVASQELLILFEGRISGVEASADMIELDKFCDSLLLCWPL
jgi:hypothetical protein